MDLAQPQVFNNSDVLTEGWYWAFRSKDIKSGAVKPFRLMKKDLVIFRGKDGKVRALDAFCPHMGAHLAEGKVEGNSLRCLFHHWKIAKTGEVEEIPCLERKPKVQPLFRWPVKEKYGLIWVYSGETPGSDVPSVPELTGEDVDYRLANRFVKECHPNVMMINAIDEQHFASVHPMAGGLATNLKFEVTTPHPGNIQFENQNPVPRVSVVTRFLSRFYKKSLTYHMSYWYGNTGSVTLGPDFLHFHIIFALRPVSGGRAEGQTILITKKRPGITGKIINSLLLTVTNIVGLYFADGDTKIFKTIKFGLRHPVPADHSVAAFIKHTDAQPLSSWSHL